MTDTSLWSQAGQNKLIVSMPISRRELTPLPVRCPTAFKRLLRWALINHGVFRLDKRIDMRLIEDPNRSSIVIFVARCEEELVHIRIDSLVRFCVLGIERPNWTAGCFANVEAFGNWLIQELGAGKPTIVSRPVMHSGDSVAPNMSAALLRDEPAALKPVSSSISGSLTH